MNTRFTFSIISLVFCFYCNAQHTLTLQPNAAQGKDAMLHGLNSNVNINYGDDEEFLISAWTYSNVPGVTRSIIDFDFTQIPLDSAILSAKLSLYARDVDGGSGFHSDLSGANDFYINRITSSWDESTVTWSTIPTISSVNRLSVLGTSIEQQDYLDIDVTLLVKDIIADRSHSFGFMVSLQDENYYRKLNFCSSDHPNNNLHPKLVITYKSRASINEIKMENKLVAYPNPSTGNISLKGEKSYTGNLYTIIDNLGKVIAEGIISNDIINIENLETGLYTLKIEGKDQTFLSITKI